MSFKYGPNSKLVTSDWINAVTGVNGTITSQGNTGINGGYEVYFRHDVDSCSPGSGVSIQLKNLMPYTHITFQWLGNGTAACWSFCQAGYAGAVASYLDTYDETKGDSFSRCYLSWEVPEFQSHGRFSACDNDANNFFRFDSTLYKSFYHTRRKDSSGNLVQISHGRTCSGPIGSYTIFRNIYVW